jgi:hypothetical protein
MTTAVLASRGRYGGTNVVGANRPSVVVARSASPSANPGGATTEAVVGVSQGLAAKRSVVRGGQARIAGRSLQTASKVVFLGRKTRRDDIAVRPRHRNDGHVDALVPSKARSGRIAVVDSMGRTATTPGAVSVVEPPAIDTAPGGGYWIGGRREPAIGATAGGEVEVLARDGTVVTTFATTGAAPAAPATTS